MFRTPLRQPCSSGALDAAMNELHAEDMRRRRVEGERCLCVCVCVCVGGGGGVPMEVAAALKNAALFFTGACG